MEEQPEYIQEQQLEDIEKQEEQFAQEWKIDINNPLRQTYEQLVGSFNSEADSVIRSFMKYRENRTYHLLVNERSDYFSSMWQHLQKRLRHQSRRYQANLLELITIRQDNILCDIMDSKLEIQFQRVRFLENQEDEKGRKVNMLREQSTEIQRKLLDINSDINQIRENQHHTSQSRFKSFQINQAKLKEYEQFVKKQKKQKQQRTKMIEELKKKEEDARTKRQQQEKQAKQKILKQKKEQLIRKMKEQQQKRAKQKTSREQRDKQYKFISKSLAQQPPLFKKIEKTYRTRYQSSQKQRRGKMLSQRHSVYQHLDSKALEQHERKYEQMLLQRDRQRRQRQQEYEKMMELQQEELQAKFKSNYQPNEVIIDQKVEERKLALEKKQRIKRYIQETVKERYLPRIDQQKRKEFLKMIEDLGKKKVKKVKREDGSYEYEEVRPSDPRMMGLEYLQKTKEMASKMRGKRKNSDQIPDITNEKPKVFDYLGQRRKKGTSMSNRDKLNFVNRKDLSFDDKLKKVELEAQKLEQLAKQKEMKLKFGKFGTSDQILQHKEEIDQHYIDIINMKLKLINFKEE